MRVLVAGATGVIGRRLVSLLTATGHEVVALSRTAPPVTGAAGAGVTVVAADALDRAALGAAVRAAAPDAVVHLLTAIPADIDPRRMERDFALTNRLRTEGTRNLLDAAREAGATRVITQGLAYAYDPAGAGPGDTGPAGEDAPFWRTPPRQWASSLEALRTLERLTGEAGGLVLRFGHLYGPGTAFARDGAFVRSIRARAMPVLGGGTATFSFTHTHDAATSIVSALPRPVTGALNIVDDHPARVGEWLPALARILHAPEPRRLPAALARPVVGSWGVAFLTRLRGADNARARLELNWRPRHLSWRDGFTEELGVR
ncbi:NAD-dependent epimerase/dehydratase family protein [Microtetraspora niveoalba]|uniref:NAD-dependent epimerase/dehydratase family protein n=1 Tax=Microtetraspora niveoalba TaxID=46175 RepID=UPI00082AAA04|nr:NAD(P)-dependent oxidoreductase [Microtetraspora niveoalba]